ncbi:MAG: hypothetical protein U5L95_05115 [Candidatus Saccharibacteria bacterium]|nr:hypothetical protein [Candidatus Saccharibacteria bacterium]
MLQLSKTYYDQAIMSLRTGGQIAFATEPLINPKNLKIEGFFCQDKFEKKELILLTQDIRDRLPQGFAVDDHSVLAEPVDLVRHREILEIRYRLPGKPVIAGKRKKLGKVVDYAVEAETMYIQKLYVGQHLLKSLTKGQLSVTRDRIIEITPKHIKIKDPKEPIKHAEKVTNSATAPAIAR